MLIIVLITFGALGFLITVIWPSTAGTINSLILLLTLGAVGIYVLSTIDIANATRIQMEAFIEPVVELRGPPRDAEHPDFLFPFYVKNLKAHHVKVWLEARVEYKGGIFPMPPVNIGNPLPWLLQPEQELYFQIPGNIILLIGEADGQGYHIGQWEFDDMEVEEEITPLALLFTLRYARYSGEDDDEVNEIKRLPRLRWDYWRRGSSGVWKYNPSPSEWENT